MNWWDILKVQQTLDVGSSPTKPVSEGAGITGLQQRASRSQQYQPSGYAVQPEQQKLFQEYGKPREQQQQPQQGYYDTFTPQSGETGGGGGGADDSDVGEVAQTRENVQRARENLIQQPQGQKAHEIAQVVTDLSAALMDPVNQRDIAVQAKRKLHEAFPMMN